MTDNDESDNVKKSNNDDSIDPLSMGNMNTMVGPILTSVMYGGGDISEDFYDEIAKLYRCTKERAKLAVRFNALWFGIMVSEDGKKAYFMPKK